ncbi:MAG TPA: hypothetical protein VH252_00870 [Chthoniobacterales bacterium]|nr:hypothetical protein [Chthoniobacterales bacterium]
MNSGRFFSWVLLVACATSVHAAEPLEESVVQKYEVDPDVTLSVENTDGAIRVYGTHKKEVCIQAIKRAYDRERLQAIVVDVKASRNRIAITTSFPPRKNVLSDRSGTVDYIIVVPQTARLNELKLTTGEIQVEGLRPGGSASARLVNGWLGGQNCFANLDLSVDTGRLDLAYSWWENHEIAIKASSARGNIRAIFPSDAALNLSAVAAEGKVANGFQSNKAGTAGVVHSVAEVIGSEAEAVVSLEARRGNIRIDKFNY